MTKKTHIIYKYICFFSIVWLNLIVSRSYELIDRIGYSFCLDIYIYKDLIAIYYYLEKEEEKERQIS